MAKSMRSKWKRKMRAIKRVRYGERETQKLVKMIEAAKEAKKQDGDDTVMALNPAEDKAGATADIVDKDAMDTTVKPKYSSRTLKDAQGNYPVWMSKRRIDKIKGKKARVKASKKEGKVTKKGKGKRKNKF